MVNLLQQFNDDMASLAQDAQRSLVHISNGRGAGAGTIWHADGLIITNAHVIAGHHGLKVTLQDGTQLPAKVIAQDDQRDLAALAVEASDLPTIAPGDSKHLRAGSWVLALGHPWGIANSVTAGIVIGVGAEWAELPHSGSDFVVMSLKVRPGNSGGPLIDVSGRLVGINTMMTGPAVGVAIPAHVVKAFLRETLGSVVQAEETSVGVML